MSGIYTIATLLPITPFNLISIGRTNYLISLSEIIGPVAFLLIHHCRRSSISVSYFSIHLVKGQTFVNYLHLKEVDLLKATLHRSIGRSPGQVRKPEEFLLTSNTHTTTAQIPL